MAAVRFKYQILLSVLRAGVKHGKRVCLARYFFLWSLLILYFSLPMFALPGTGDELKAEDVFKMSLEELINVEVSGPSRFSHKSGEAPASVMVITEKQIKERGYGDLSEVLRDVPGLDMVENSGRFGEVYTIRGINGNDRFLVLIDGHKLNPFSGTFLSVGRSIAIRFVKQVEIIFGPASALYGADAFAGIINIVTRKAEDIKTAEAAVHGAYGSYGTADVGLFLHLPFEMGSKKHKGMFSLSGRLYHSDEFSLEGRDPIYDIVNTYASPLTQEFRQPTRDYTIFAALEYRDFRVSFYRQRFDQGNGYGMNPQFYVFNDTNHWAFTTDILRLAYQKETKSNEITVDVSYTGYRQDTDTMFHKFNLLQYMTGKDNTFKLAASFKHLFSKKFKVIVGADYEHTVSIPAYANDEVLGFPYQNEGENKERIDEALTVRERRGALFMEILAKPLAKTDLTLFLGGRFDYSHLNQDTFNPRIGAILKLSNATTFKFLYGRAFQAPSLFYKYEQFGIPTLIMLPNTALENQELQTYELCLVQRLGSRLLLNLSFFHNHLKNLIVRAPLPGTYYNKYYDKYTEAIQNTNAGKQVSWGFNATFDLVLRKNLAGYLYYDFVDSVFEIIEENPMPGVANHHLWGGLTYTGIKGLTVSPRFRWVGAIHTATSNPIYPSPQKQPGFVEVDLYLSYKGLLPRTRFFLGIYNLFDSDISHPGLFGQSGAYVPLVHQPERHFKLGVEIEL